MSVRYDAGVSTAYGAAVAGGYTGSYEEFCAALGALANVLEDLENFTVEITTLPAGEQATASYADGVLSLGIPKGDKGDTGATGNGIASITKTGTSGLVDTYTILYTDGTSTTFTVTNGEKGDKGDKGDTGATGNGIASITLTSTSGAVKTYTILYTDGTSTTFDVTDGEVTNAVLEEALDTKADVVVNTASGVIASFTDGAAMPVKSLDVDIKPVQDLHGQDAPYPAGGEKNLADFDKTFPLSASNIKITDFGENRTFAAITITLFCTNAVFENNGNTVIRLREGENTDINLTTADFGMTANTPLNGAYSVTRTNVTFQKVFWIYYPNFTSGSMKIQVESGSTSTAYVPYSNICPITGWDAVKVTRTGKNLFNVDDVAKISVGAINRRIGVYFKKSGTYTVSAQASGNYMYCRVFNADSTTKATYYIVSSTTITNATFTISDGEYFAVYYASETTINGAKQAFNTWKAQVELSSTATSYEPYNGQTVTVQLGQTVYGGTLNVDTGVLTVDGAIVDMGSLNWSYNSSANLFVSSGIASAVKSQYNAICSTYKWLENPRSTAFDANDKCFGINKTEDGHQINGSFGVGILLVKDTAYSDADTFKAAVNGKQLCYKLATPLTIQLTAEQLSTIKGTNNIFADSGDVSVQYGADTKLYIEGSIVTPSLAMIAPIENGTTASQAYTAGQYFLHNNVFCKAKTNIASGATFTLNTNYEETTIAAELYAALH